MKSCYFCGNNIRQISYQETEHLKKFLDRSGRIAKRRKTDMCAKHQRQFKTAVKRARFMALLSYLTP